MRNLIVLFTLVALAAGYTWYDSAASRTQFAPQTMLPPAPDFTFTTLDGERHSLSDFKGKAVVLNFWATWCAPCVVEFPDMLALAAATKETSVFIFLSQDQTDEDIEKFLKRHAPMRPQNVFVARDDGKTIAQQLYQTYKLPETYMIDRDLRITRKIVGNSAAWNSDLLRQEIGRMAAAL